MDNHSNGKFNPAEHMTKIQGRDYLEVKWRIVWFREAHPNGRIETELIHSDDSGAGFIARVVTDQDFVMATGHGYATPSQAKMGRVWEKAETAAIGRALAHAGFGTQFTDEDEEGHLADSPVGKPANGSAPLVDNRHWTRQPELVKAFETYCKEKTLEMVNAIDALNDATDYDVKQLVDYKGSRDEAKAAIEKWITKQLNGGKKDILEMDAAGLKTLLSISASELEHDAKFKIANRKHKEKICASRTKAALQGNDDKRKRLMHWLFNQTSFTEVSDAQLQGMWVYLGSVQEFGVGVDPRIAKEMETAYDAAITEGKEFGGFDEYEPQGEGDPEEMAI